MASKRPRIQIRGHTRRGEEAQDKLLGVTKNADGSDRITEVFASDAAYKNDKELSLQWQQLLASPAKRRKTTPQRSPISKKSTREVSLPTQNVNNPTPNSVFKEVTPMLKPSATAPRIFVSRPESHDFPSSPVLENSLFRRTRVPEPVLERDIERNFDIAVIRHESTSPPPVSWLHKETNILRKVTTNVSEKQPVVEQDVIRAFDVSSFKFHSKIISSLMRTSRNPSPPPRTWLHEELKIKDNVPSPRLEQQTIFEPQVPVAFEEQNSEDDSFLYRPSKYRKSRRPTPPPSPPVSPIGKTVPTHENEHESCGQPISIVDDEQPRHTPQKGGKSKTTPGKCSRRDSMGLSGGFFADVPIFSDIDLAPELRAFFVRYPFLKKKPGYRAPDFLGDMSPKINGKKVSRSGQLGKKMVFRYHSTEPHSSKITALHVGSQCTSGILSIKKGQSLQDPLDVKAAKVLTVLSGPVEVSIDGENVLLFQHDNIFVPYGKHFTVKNTKERSCNMSFVCNKGHKERPATD